MVSLGTRLIKLMSPVGRRVLCRVDDVVFEWFSVSG